MKRGSVGGGLLAALAAVLQPAAAQLPAFAPRFQLPAEVTDPRVREPAPLAERTRLLAEGEAALARGDTAQALAAFERAAMMLHAADTELGLVRSYLQAGEYRRAMAFCAHTAGAHREVATPSALYAWLLAAGGQPAFAQRVLDEARQRAPADVVVADVGRRLAHADAVASVAMLQGPHRMAPEALAPVAEPPLPAAARVVASGLLWPGGERALVPLEAADAGRALWLRNGLGRSTRASVAQRLPALGIAVMQLAAPLDSSSLELAQRDGFAGSAAYAVDYSPAVDATPAWPRLYTGFLGAPDRANAGLQRLGVDVPATAQGGPVFDAAGRLAGIVQRGADGGALLLSASRLREALGDAPPDGPLRAVHAPARMALDEAYERSLRSSLQVIVAP